MGSPPAGAAPTGLRVVGGAPTASIAAFPFQAGLFVQTPAGLLGRPGLAFCGGVVIDPVQILTAAHCVTDERTGAPVNPAVVTALVGTAGLPPTAPTQPVASQIAVHPEYARATADYDIAVVTMAAPLYAGSPRADGAATVAPIPLITPALAEGFANPGVTPAQPAVVSGWGQTSPVAVGAQPGTGSLAGQLQAAQTHLVADATCAAEYAGVLGLPAITPRMLCAGEPGGGIDACAGDSGGPLVVDVNAPATPPGDYVLAGLVDFGAGCAQPGYPGVYVRLAAPAIAAFIAQAAAVQGQQLIAPPAPVVPSPPPPPPPPPTPVTPVATPPAARSGPVSLARATAAVKRRVARVGLRCQTARCTGTLTLRTTIRLGLVRFALPADTTATVSLPITLAGQRQLDRHHHRLRVRATLQPTGSAPTHPTVTLTG